jgi:hypothetical protein
MDKPLQRNQDTELKKLQRYCLIFEPIGAQEQEFSQESSPNSKYSLLCWQKDVRNALNCL